jgi:glycosyltransferase involved in cell wall biosynthesis
MKVSGFTFIRNAIKYDYPILEAIQSILPLCDEVVVAVGNSDDDTLALIQSLQSDKIRIIETVWNDSLREGGTVLALETDKAFQAIAEDSDWAFYIQGDEVLHEQYLETIRENMITYKDDVRVDGLLFNYLHFYGSYDYVGEAYSWYRREIRIIKNDRNIFSYRDAQGFRKKPNNKLNVIHIPATIHHYGYVREPKAMEGKKISFNRYWHSDEWINQNVIHGEVSDYSDANCLSKFTGTHPFIMKKRINVMNWKFDFDLSYNRFSLKDRFKRLVEKLTGWRVGEYKNYKIVNQK